MAQSMHGGYNKNDNETLKASGQQDASKTLVGNWAEERALQEVQSWVQMVENGGRGAVSLLFFISLGPDNERLY